MPCELHDGALLKSSAWLRLARAPSRSPQAQLRAIRHNQHLAARIAAAAAPAMALAQERALRLRHSASGGHLDRSKAGRAELEAGTSASPASPRPRRRAAAWTTRSCQGKGQGRSPRSIHFSGDTVIVARLTSAGSHGLLDARRVSNLFRETMGIRPLCCT